MTFQDAINRIPVRYHNNDRFIGNWVYNTFTGYARNLYTGERFKGDWLTFLIEKKVVDIYAPDYEYYRS